MKNLWQYHFLFLINWHLYLNIYVSMVHRINQLWIAFTE
ncbi:hypothetical protein DJ66_0944 [Candidatus Liberibacter solanacearum]|uniref:Uncharacterized protein n=1 Tax=Candidatus Liberibacter solanacearum TaxID=556287 RepID=A0A0F4VNG7_9HYPH|nr:hypothetical protein DJ66_0944 [Candidatus Liberibacter solanacearum]